MKRMLGTQWRLDRDLGEPEDEFFGLLEEDDLPNEPPEEDGPRKPSLLQRLISLLIARDEPEEDPEDLDDLKIEPYVPIRAKRDDLEDYMTRLPAGREWEEFLQAEQQVGLFATIQQARARRVRASAWALWLVGAFWLLIGWQHGRDYLTQLTNPDIARSEWFARQALRLSQSLDSLVSDPVQFSQQAAHAAVIVFGILAPVGAFLLSATTLAVFIGAVVERRLLRGVLSLFGLMLLLGVFAMMSSGMYVSAAVIAFVAWASVRICEWIMIRLGVY